MRFSGLEMSVLSCRTSGNSSIGCLCSPLELQMSRIRAFTSLPTPTNCTRPYFRAFGLLGLNLDS